MLQHMRTIVTGQNTAWVLQEATLKKVLKMGEPCMETVNKLNEWWQTIKQHDYTLSMITPAAVLSDKIIEKITSVSSITTHQYLSAILADEWGLESKYGNELFAFLASINPPLLVLVHKRTLTMAEKRKDNGQEGDGRCENEGRRKKQRLAYETLNPMQPLQTTFQVMNYTPAGHPRL